MKKLPTLIAAALFGAFSLTPAAAQSLSDGMAPGVAPHAPAATVLLRDDAGTGHLIESFGDVRTARHIAVLVPGVSWTGPTVRDESTLSRRHPAVQARALWAAMRRLDPGAPVAVVVWLNYDPPATLNLDAARSERAVAGAVRLAAFVNSLPARANVTLICHSYGSVVCAHAASAARLTDLIAVGSPGMDVPNAAALRTTARVWAGQAGDDPIGLVPHTRIDGVGHGTDPTDPTFGARPLPVEGAHGHNGYLAPGTLSLLNVARITVGRADQVTEPAPDRDRPTIVAL